MPASTPTAVSTGGRTSIGHSTRIETNQRPAVSRLTVTVDGSSGADFALAFVDEIEQGRHYRERFTVAY